MAHAQFLMNGSVMNDLNRSVCDLDDLTQVHQHAEDGGKPMIP